VFLKEVFSMYRGMRRLAVAGALTVASFAFSAVAAGPANAAVAPQEVSRPISTGIVVSAISTRGLNGALDEFVELQNIGSTNIDIAGYTLSACLPSPIGREVLLATVQSQLAFPPEPGQPPTQVFLAPGETYLIANEQFSGVFATPNQTYATLPSQTPRREISDLGGVIVRTASNAYVDAVGFSSGLPCTETAPARPQVGNRSQVNLRVGQFGQVDTNVNARDFRLIDMSMVTALRPQLSTER
jgi:hypothetical protein